MRLYEDMHCDVEVVVTIILYSDWSLYQESRNVITGVVHTTVEAKTKRRINMF